MHIEPLELRIAPSRALAFAYVDGDDVAITTNSPGMLVRASKSRSIAGSAPR